jgi:trimeric autotransporter adhesin
MRTPQRQTAGAFAFRRSPLVAALAFAFIAPSAFAVADPNLVVTNQLDDGLLGSLTYAINYANTNCAVDPAPVITFNIAGTGPFVISPSTTLPYFYCPSTSPYNPSVHGGSQAGSTPNGSATGFDAAVMIVIDGAASSFYGGSCLLQSSNNGYGGTMTVDGMELRNYNYGSYQAGVCGTVTLLGNRIVSNGRGVSADANSTIGGPNPSDRNVIADHPYGAGIVSDGTGMFIVNNLIGTRDGVTAALNQNGIQWDGCCTTPTGTISGNVIAASSYGIDMAYADGLQISDNMIGTDASGTSLLGAGSYGISLYYSYGASISGNTISGWATGIEIYNSGGVGYPGIQISGNKIGTDKSGSTALANQTGIYDAYSYGTLINGGNVISGNSDTGVWLSGTNYATVQGNYLGTNATGASGLGNFFGAYLGVTAANNTFDNNTIAGNSVGLYFSDASNISVTNNRIGVLDDGTTARGNTSGLYAECGASLTISGNTISGNSEAGMRLFAIQASMIDGNNIGVASNGATSVPNGGHGVELGPSYCGGAAFGSAIGRSKSRQKKATNSIVFGADNQPDGNSFAGNVIANNSGTGLRLTGGNNNAMLQNLIYANTGDGIRIGSEVDPAYGTVISAATGNSMHENLVFGNAAKNINLGFDGGPLPNDAADIDGMPPDIGRPNNWQNRPVIGSVVRDPANNWTMVDFTLDSQPGTYRIDIYANPSPGQPAGQTWISNTFLTIASVGPVSGSYAIPGITLDNISALASRDDAAPYDTSEFADIVPATTLPTPAVQVVPSSVNFGDVVVSRQSPDSTITITSTGTAPYVISALRDSSCTGPPICSTGAFVCSTTCLEATPYSAPSSCTITASFAPTALGSQTKTLALCDNAVGSPRTITFTGNGVTPSAVDISMSPASYYFGEVLVGAQSASRNFTVSNAGTTQVYLGTVQVTGDFSLIGNTCGPTLEAGASCGADVVFVPTAAGIVSGTVAVTGSNAPLAAAAKARAKVAVTSPTTNTVSATLQGSGIQFGDLRLPSSISFGTSVLHGSVARQFVTINNSGNGVLTLGTISVAGPFTLVNGCGATLEPGASCALTLEFTPGSLGSFNGTLTVISNAPGGSRTIALSAQVIAEARPVVTVNPTKIGFGDRVVGTAAVRQRVIVTNEGSQDASLGTLTVLSDSGNRDFRIDTTSCTATLAPQATCFADVFMQPVGFGDRTGQLLVPSNSRDTPATVGMTGRGCRPFTVGAVRSGRDPCSP